MYICIFLICNLKNMFVCLFFFFIYILFFNFLWGGAQSGCCKPPTACNYNMAPTVAQDPDCYRWNNAPNLLCYECDSCKAGVLEDIRRDWHKLSVLNIVMLVLLIGIYCIGCCAFQNTKRAETDYPYGENRMRKVRPRWDYYWYVKTHTCLYTIILFELKWVFAHFLLSGS